MTPQEAKLLAPIIAAYGDGETIQYIRADGAWMDMLHPGFNGNPKDYRIKPKPRLVPMTHEDLPPVFWVSQDGGRTSELVTVIHPDGRLETEREYISHDDLCNWRWSTDRKTWQEFTKEAE